MDKPIQAARPELREVDLLNSFREEANNEHPKTPLENLQNILAKADALAAAEVPPQTKAIFTIEGEGVEAAVEENWDSGAGAGDFRKINEAKSPAPSISKFRLRSVLTAVQQFPQEMLSRQRLTDLLTGDLCHSDPAVVKAVEESHREEIWFDSAHHPSNHPEQVEGLRFAQNDKEIIFSENIKKLDELIKAFKCGHQ